MVEQEQKLGQKIKKLRELRNYTQEYIAEKLGISQTSYSNIERDEIEITIKKLFQICEVLGIKLNDILGFDEDKAVLVGTMSNNATGTQNGVVYNNTTFDRERKLYEERIQAQEKEILFLRGLLGK